MSAAAMPATGLRLADLAVGWRPWLVLVTLCICLFLPGIAAMPPLDRDEARFMQATRQMVQSGDLLQIRFQDEARNKKPVGIHWLQAAAVAALGDPEATTLWPYRLPSLLGAVAAVLLTFHFGRALVGAPAALAGAAFLAASIALVVEAHLAKTDAVLLAAIVAGQGALASVRASARAGAPAPARLWLLFWAAEGIALLVKGPVGPLVAVLTALGLSLVERDWRWLAALRPAWGVPLALLFVAPWLVAVELATQGGFLADAVGHDLLGKVAAGQEAHGAPPGTYLALVWATFWPGSILLAGAAVLAWRRRRDPEVRFLLAWLVPAWLLFELVPTKLPHYVLPLYPALALLSGAALVAAIRAHRAVEIAVLVLWLGIGGGLAAASVAAPIHLGGGFLLASLVPALGIAAMAWLALSRRLLALPVAAIAVLAPILSVVLPRSDQLWVSREAAAMVARHVPGAGPVASVGYSEPSLVVLLGTATRLIAADQAAAELASGRIAAALVGDRDDEAFRRSLASRGAAARPVDKVAGFNYSRGRRVTLTLYERG